jgi:hypothetical protein
VFDKKVIHTKICTLEAFPKYFMITSVNFKNISCWDDEGEVAVTKLERKPWKHTTLSMIFINVC